MSMIRCSEKLLRVGRILALSPATPPVRSIKRWVAPTLRELNKRAKKLGPVAPQPRSSFVEWNYRAELFAFGKRLKEEFEMPLLQTAFTQQSYIAKEEMRQRDLGIEEIDVHMTHNNELSQKGHHITKECIEAFIEHSLPKVPAEGKMSIVTYLMSPETLSNVAFHLGMKELLLDAEYPPSNISMAKSLLAVIAALEKSSGMQKAFIFVKDFVCTQLSQKDVLELWNIENPEKLLKHYCREQKLGEPEPRLLGDCGRNTVLSAYHVGLYCNKKLIGKGFGEDIPTAVKTASLDALQTMFGLHDNMKPLNFKMKVQSEVNSTINQ